MALSVFNDRSAAPTEEELAAALGTTYPLWTDLIRRLAPVCAPFSVEWGFTGKSTGWGLRARKGSRIIVYLAPREGYFLASFALGERAVRAANAGDAGELPGPVLALIDNARRYAEGRAVRMEVRRADDVDPVLTLAAIKVAN